MASDENKQPVCVETLDGDDSDYFEAVVKSVNPATLLRAVGGKEVLSVLLCQSRSAQIFGCDILVTLDPLEGETSEIFLRIQVSNGERECPLQNYKPLVTCINDYRAQAESTGRVEEEEGEEEPPTSASTTTDARTAAQIFTQLCQDHEANVPKHPQVIVQRITARTPRCGFGSRLLTEMHKAAAEHNLCLQVQSPVTEAGRALVRKLGLVDPAGYGGCFTWCREW